MEEKELKIGYFVADMMGISHDDQGNFTFHGPEQYDDFNARWAKVLAVFE